MTREGVGFIHLGFDWMLILGDNKLLNLYNKLKLFHFDLRQPLFSETICAD